MQMIPKVIHYCWFGYGRKNEVTIKCLESWRKKLPGYQVKVWDELSFDVDSNRFVKEAYSQKKWAFVTDYVRLYALYNEGGIYLDTDVEVFRELDELLEHPAFTGFEEGIHIPTGTMGAAKGNSWIKRMLDYYEDRPFIKSDGTLDLIPNPQIITGISQREYGLQCNNLYQVLNGNVYIYPKEYFCVDSGVFDCYTKHHFNGSWTTDDYKGKALFYKRMYTLLAHTLTVSDDTLKSRLQALNLPGKNIAFLQFDETLAILAQRLKGMELVNIIGCIVSGMAGYAGGIQVIEPQDLLQGRVDTLIIATMLNVRDVKQQLGGFFSGQVLSVEDLLDDYIIY